MEVQAQIVALENLALADAALQTLEQELGEERAQLGGKQDQLMGLDARIEAARVSIAQMDRTRQELIGEARQMSLQLERSREKLGRCRTEREVNAAQREMEELRKLYRDREIELEKLNGLADQAHADLLKFDQQRTELAHALGQTEGASRVRDLTVEADKARAAREELAAKLPQTLRRRYDRILKARGVAIAYSSDGTCSACHIALAPMHFQTLRRASTLDQCPACQRLLYYKDPEELAAEGADDEVPPAEPEAGEDVS